jgi:Uma2 family endonuclease
MHEGYRVELINGEIIVTPPANGDHEDIIGQIAKQIVRLSQTEMDFSGHKGLILSSAESGGDARVIPDLTVAPEERRLFRGAPPWMPAADVELVVEVTSTRAEVDRKAKRRGYATAGIRYYLLVDREWHEVTIFSGPIDDDYARYVTIAFGGKLELPEPFGFELDTSDFPG